MVVMVNGDDSIKNSQWGSIKCCRWDISVGGKNILMISSFSVVWKEKVMPPCLYTQHFNEIDWLGNFIALKGQSENCRNSKKKGNFNMIRGIPFLNFCPSLKMPFWSQLWF